VGPRYRPGSPSLRGAHHLRQSSRLQSRRPHRVGRIAEPPQQRRRRLDSLGPRDRPSHGSRALTGSVTGFVAILWDVETGREIRRFEGHTLPVLNVAFGPHEPSSPPHSTAA
jgi:WD40 repeat protein